MNKKSQTMLKTLLLSSAFSCVLPLSVQAEDASAGAGEEVESLEEIITVGTRRKGRTVTESLAPVDVFNAETLESTGYTDMNDSLRTLVPSFNVMRIPSNDGSTFVRPFTLKGSPPDHALLLLNGKRRHKSALVNLALGNGSNTAGSQGSDLNQIPSIAFSDIQVLRDGAAAQYGSDAIAGVVNLSMKNASEGGSVVVSYGQFYEGDGENLDVAGNIGLPLSANGFLNLSAQYVNQNPTDRSIQTPGAAALQARGFDGVPDPAMVWGNPNHESIKTSWNGGLDLNEDMEAYFFGNFAKSTSDGGFWYRHPEVDAAYTADPDAAVGHFDPSKASRFDESPEHPGRYDLRSIYPGGFTPRFGAKIKDFSQIVGVRGETDGNLSWDTSFRWGRSDVEYNIKNTINPSLGNASPTEFTPGSLAQREIQINVDVSYPLQNDIFADDLVISAGAEWKDEAYIIGLGDPASYAQGPLKDLPVGSNGFPGFGPDQAGFFSRHNYSAYLDLETEVMKNWSVGVAGRFEDYSDFGSTWNYKVATRYQVTDNFALRGSISTGFRAPSGGQLYTKNVSTDFTDDPIPVPIVSGLFPPASLPAQYFNGGQLGPEESTNYTAGFVFATDSGLSLTVDFYQIDISDRMLLAGPFSVTAADRAALAGLGVSEANSLGQVKFFKNLFDTRTRGVDVVATYNQGWDNGSSTDLMLAWNYNDQDLKRFNPGDFPTASQKNFEDGEPASKGSLTIIHHLKNFDILVRGNYYGTAWKGRSDGNHSEFKAALLLDLELTYYATENIAVSLTGRNILDKYPGSYGGEDWGLPYWSSSPYGFNGGYYAAKVKYNF